MLMYNSGFQKQAVTIVEGLPFWQTLQLMSCGGRKMHLHRTSIGRWQEGKGVTGRIRGAGWYPIEGTLLLSAVQSCLHLSLTLHCKIYIWASDDPHPKTLNLKVTTVMFGKTLENLQHPTWYYILATCCTSLIIQQMSPVHRLTPVV